MRPAPALFAPATAARPALALAVLLAAVTAAGADALPAPAPRVAVRAPAGPAREALLTVPADLPAELLGEEVSASVAVRALVSPAGLVDSARAVSGDERLREAAEASVRWWVFAPAEGAAWVTVAVPIDAPADAEPLRPDVLAIARQSEEGGDLPTALAAWVGALNRLGRSPVARNGWNIRERTMALARRISPPPAPGDAIGGPARGARGQQLRTVARAAHGALVEKFETALTSAPWWDEPYLWHAGSLAGCGRAPEALRSLRAYRLASSDSAGRAFADRMIDRLAAADTIGVCEAIKNWGVVSESTKR